MKFDTIENIVQRVLALYTKGAPSDETRLTTRHIYSVVSSLRATLLEQQAKKKQKINQMNYQTILIEMEEVDSELISTELSIPNCTYFRSKTQLPNVLSNMDKMLIQSVSNLDYSIKFSEASTDKIRYSSGNRYAKKALYYFVENDYLIIPCETYVPSYIKFTALFSDPLEAELLNSKNKCKAHFEYDFKTDPGITSTIIQMAVEELIKVFGVAQEDVSNNSRDSVIETSK